MFTRIYEKYFIQGCNVNDSIDTGETFIDASGTVRSFYTFTAAASIYHIRKCMQNIGKSYSSGCVVFGTGDVAPTKDDYCLSGDLITTISGTYAFTNTFDENGYTLEAIYTLTNTGTDSITIKEIAAIGIGKYSSNYSTACLWDRTVLDTPVTIPAGGVGQVAYTIRFNYPTT